MAASAFALSNPFTVRAIGAGRGQPLCTSLILTAPTIQLCEEQGAPSEGVAVGNLPRQEIEPDKAVADLF